MPKEHKDVGYLRRKPKITALAEHGTGRLTDLSGNHTIRMDWHLNDNAHRDKIFKMTIDDKVVYLDVEELLYYTRIMFV
jgi:hypothetical protein